MKTYEICFCRAAVFISCFIFIFTGNLSAQDIVEKDITAVENLAYAKGTWYNANIRSVFEHLSEVSGIDFVLDPNVSGEITLSVTNKTWKEVCDIVCKMKQLLALQEDEYIYIIREKDFVAHLKDKEIGKKDLDEVKSLERAIVKLSNITASEMVGPARGFLSRRGKITVVEHNNSLIIYDIKENIDKIKALIAKLDIEVEQISISAKIIEVASGVINDLGIQWSLFDRRIEHLPTETPGEGIIATALERASYGIINPRSFSIALEYLFTENKSDIIAQPQVITLDNKEARIFMGSQIPLTYLDMAGNPIVRMIDAGTELTVTPHVTSEGRVRLSLRPTKKSYEMTTEGPIIHEQSAQTNVVVNDGETVVIAGLTSDEKRDYEGGIPILKDIPLIGNLFKKSNREEKKRDLIIFVTPHIIKKDIPSVVNENDKSSITKDTLSIPAE